LPIITTSPVTTITTSPVTTAPRDDVPRIDEVHSVVDCGETTTRTTAQRNHAWSPGIFWPARPPFAPAASSRRPVSADQWEYQHYTEYSSGRLLHAHQWFGFPLANGK
jgi:hypothetical protein